MSTATGVDYNPFPGLRPFREDEEHLFFGRENRVDAIVTKLAAARLLAVMGPSGSGKSSLLNCGLIPALRGGLMAEAGPAWKVAALRPGGAPLEALAQALATALFTDHEADSVPIEQRIETTLRASKHGLAEVYKQAQLPEPVKLLVVVDQFEEVFRFGQLRATEQGEEEEWADDESAFVGLLLKGQQQTDLPIYVALTMRSDFLEDCALFAGLPEAINKGQYLLPRMTRDECRVAIAGPVAVGGATMEPTLLTRLIDDVGDNPGQLLLLQYALNRTWAYWQAEQANSPEKGSLALSHYEAIGTMEQALDAHAEQAYENLGSVRKQQICEKLFKALTYKGPDRRGVRRPTKLVTLCALTGANEADSIAEVIAVIDVFRAPSCSFLKPLAPVSLRAETVVDLAHESLMQVWGRLMHWVEEEAESARMYYRLAEEAQRYEAGQINLWRDPELQLAEDWREANDPTKHWALQYHPGYEAAMSFLEASLALRAEKAAAAAALQQRELDRTKALAVAKAESARRFRLGFLIATGVAVVALLIALFALNAQRVARENLAEAQRQREAAETARDSLRFALNEVTEQRLEAERQRNLANDNAAETLRLKALAEAALADAERQRLNTQAVQNPPSVTAAERRQTLGLVLANNALAEMRRGNKTRGAMLAREAFLINQGNGGAFFSDVYEALRQTLNGLQPQLGGPQNASWRASTNNYTVGDTVQATSPDDQLRAMGSPDGMVRVETDGAVIALRGHQGPVTKVAFSPDGTLLASGSEDRSVRLWKIDPIGKPSTTPFLVLGEHTNGVIDLYFEDNGEALVTRSADQTVRRWRIKPERLMDAVCAVMGRGFALTRAEWDRYVDSAIDYDEHRPCPE